jgi:hypothetical protein
VRIFEDGVLIAAHPLLEGRNRRRIDPAHRKAPPPRPPEPRPPEPRAPEPRPPDIRRPLAFYDAVGRRLAAEGAAP